MYSIKILWIFFLVMFSLKTNANDKLKIGDPAPTSAARTDEGAPIDLIDVYKKNKYVLVYFFPKANTPGCTAQACSLRDSYKILHDKGVSIIGVSLDTVSDLAQFKKDQKLPFTLVADQDKDMVKAFGVDTFLGLAKRQAFLIRDGKLIWMDRSASTKEQAKDVLKIIEEQK